MINPFQLEPIRRLQWWLDVINAVARFCSPRNIRFNVHTPDFWFQKP